MRVLLITAVCLSLLAVAPASARDIVEVPIGFDKGEFRTTITGRIQGYQIKDGKKTYIGSIKPAL